MPGGFGLDIFNQIVNVQWGGAAIFVVKNADAALYRGTGDIAEKKWELIGQPKDIFGDLGGSSYAEIGKTDTEPGTPVFVISAQRTNDNNDDGSVILASSDGRNWTIAFEKYEENVGAHSDPWIFQPTGIVWDEDSKTFYASFYTVIADFDEIGGVTTVDGERVYKSSDGYNWSLTINDVSHDLSDDDRSHLLDYCKKPENTMGNKPVPDGLQAYNKTSKTCIKPKSLTKFSPINGAIYDGSDSSVEIIVDTDEGRTKTTVSISHPCFAVAQFNGIWAACGGSGHTFAVDVSTDNGKNWKPAYTDSTFPALTASAGRKPSSESS